jgi:RNA polymerase primary sigma factor
MGTKKKKLQAFPKDRSTVNLVSSYMAQIARVNLLTADEERVIAENLVAAELRFWTLVLKIPRGLRTAAEVFETGYDEPGALGQALETAQYDTDNMPGAKALEALAWHCRVEDPDRVFFSNVMMRLNVRLQRARKQGVFAKNLTAAQSRKVTAVFDDVLEQRNHFVKCNLRLVVSVARDFHHHSLSLLDLVQDGNLGLIRAVHRFDPRMGFRFSTYAHWWIRQAIERSILNRGSTIRVPVHVHDARRVIRRAERTLERELDRKPTDEEVAERAGTTAAKVEDINTNIPGDPFSLDAKVGRGEGDARLMDFIADLDSRAPDDEAIAKIDGDRAVALLSNLTAMERDIVARRFGLAGAGIETLESIGASYNLSRERIRQIQARTLDRLRGLVASPS